MAKTKRPAAPRTKAETSPAAEKPTMAKLQAQIDDLTRQVADSQHRNIGLLTSLGELEDGLKNANTKVDQLTKDADEAFESLAEVEQAEDKLIALNARLDAMDKTIRTFLVTKNELAAWREDVITQVKPRFLSWVPTIMAGLFLIAVFVVKQLPDKQPGPQPDDGQQQIIDEEKPEKAKKLTGTVLFIHDRDPLTAEHAKLLDEARALQEAEGSEFSVRSYDSQDDPNPTLKKLIAAAKSQGIEPPLMAHMQPGSDKVTYKAMPSDWDSVVKQLAR
jgi:uncharacterized phage infection (PIP) family protein YhgE